MRYVIGLVALLMMSCNEQPVNQIIPYYDISIQLRDQILTLYHEEAYVIKYNVYNGKSEQVINRKPDWNKEFDPLFEADIHLPSLIGLYQADTMMHEDSTINITYKPTRDDLTIRKLSVHVNPKNDLVGFNATLSSNSLLSTTTREINYERYRSYTYKVTEVNKYSSNVEYSVKGEIHLDDEYFQ